MLVRARGVGHVQAEVRGHREHLRVAVVRKEHGEHGAAVHAAHGARSAERRAQHGAGAARPKRERQQTHRRKSTERPSAEQHAKSLNWS